MTYTNVDQVPARRQWEANSAPNQPYNCGPTSVSFQADFYRDATFGIEATRDLGTVANGAGTSAQEQSVMLAKRGVPNVVERPTPARLTELVGSGRRPVTIGLNMAAVPSAIRGHSFTGIHAVVVRRNAVIGGVAGKLVMDPNFGYGHTVDTTNGARFYPDSVIEGARRLTATSWRAAIVPINPKVVQDVDRTITITNYPGRRDCATKGGSLTGYRLNPPPLTKSGTFGAGSGFHSDAEYTIDPTPAGWPPGPYQRAVDGHFDGYLLANAQITLGPVPTAGGVPPAEVERAKKQSAHDAAKDVSENGSKAYASTKYPPPT